MREQLRELLGRKLSAADTPGARHEYVEMERWMVREFVRLRRTGWCDYGALFPLFMAGLDVAALAAELDQ